ncbi:MAG: hypothetical protein HFE78_04330 [Clostridiales bacterium]|nr:hypothetical protein [Clostridiales bacterium]
MKDKQRKIIRWTGTGSDLFEEVYFILKDKNGKKEQKKKEEPLDMAAAANQIVSEGLIGGYFAKERAKKRIDRMLRLRLIAGIAGGALLLAFAVFWAVH